MTEDKEKNREQEDITAAAQSEVGDVAAAPAEDIDTDEKTEKEPTEAEKLAEAEAEIARLKDQYLRQVAEFDNFRKRTMKEKADIILSGGQRVVEKLLPVLDDLDRAQQNMAAASDVDTLKEGVDLIIDKLMKTLATEGLKRMETQGVRFDTDYHEAIAIIPAGDDESKGCVMDCVQPGYMMGEKVIRHAKVVVGQ